MKADFKDANARSSISTVLLSAMQDAETKAWEGLRGYKFWMFGYHAARWVNYNQLLPNQYRFRNPFKALVDIADAQIERTQAALAVFELSNESSALLGSEGDGA